MMTRKTTSIVGEGRRSVGPIEEWKPNQTGDAILETALETFNVKDLVANKAGKKMVRAALQRVIDEILADAFGSSGDISEQIRRQAEVQTKKALRDGWSENREVVTVEHVVRRQVEASVSKEIADRYSVHVEVRLEEK